ncbi:hypothetical protein [Campylobacter rectus]|uniref:hypothetical protein n=1 Tax=Campylobacter rectus TaxID=203 RepID=UPI0028E83608|nr:hypothetical protein [Campylobacter rectus]
MFEVFFSGKTKNKNELDKNDLNKFKIIDINNEYHLAQEQFAFIFYKDSDKYNIALEPKKYPASIYLYNRGLYNPDFAKLAFVFGSLKVG